VKSWAEELDWSTRQISKKMKDFRLGSYEAPALLMQKETTRVLLDPVARFAPGADGVVDLYLMPAYDDIASLYFVDGEWCLHYMFSGTPTVATIRQAQSFPLSKDAIGRVLDEMSSYGERSEKIGALKRGVFSSHTLADNRRFPTHPSQGERPWPSPSAYSDNGDNPSRSPSNDGIASRRSGPRSRPSSSRSRPNAAMGA